jgi:hypothetical protein
MNILKMVLIILPIIISPTAIADEGSTSADGSSRADACDKATQKAIDGAQSHIRFEKATKVSRSDKEAEVQTSECSCSVNNESSTMSSNRATCQVKWTVKWPRQ